MQHGDSEERPDTSDALALIDELEATSCRFTLPKAATATASRSCCAEGVAFFVMREEGVAAGCGGVQLYGSEYGEIKRMYVRPQFRGLGLGKAMLNHLADYARAAWRRRIAARDRHPPA